MGELDPVNDVVNLFLRDDQAEAAGVLKTISLRLDLGQLVTIDAMAGYSNLSRQAMVRQLLRAGIAAVRGQLPAVVVKEIEDDIAERYEAIQAEGGI